MITRAELDEIRRTRTADPYLSDAHGRIAPLITRLLDAIDEMERERDTYKAACLSADASVEHWRVKHEAAVLDLGRMTGERDALAANIDAKCALASGAVLYDPLLLELLARGNYGLEDPVVDYELRERLTAIIRSNLT